MSRNHLHVPHLDEFKTYLVNVRGVEVRDGRGEYEVLQVSIGKQWACIYMRQDMTEHFTVDKRIDHLVTDFYQGRKKKKPEEPKAHDVHQLQADVTIPFDDEVRFILGRPIFWCGSLSRDLRDLGHEIPKKAEEEQAYVLYWMLGLYAQHGSEWRTKFEEAFQKT